MYLFIYLFIYFQSGTSQNHSAKGMPGMQQQQMPGQMTVGAMNQVPPPLMSQTPQPSMGWYNYLF